MKDRLAQIMSHEGLTAVKFAEIMEVQPSSISHLLSGRNRPNFDFVSRLLLRFPDYNPDWIINGQEPVYKSKEPVKSSEFTCVNKEEITNVNINDAPHDREETLPISGLYHQETKTIASSANIESKVTDVNKKESDSVAQPAISSIERIIIFYTDGTFQEYQNRLL